MADPLDRLFRDLEPKARRQINRAITRVGSKVTTEMITESVRRGRVSKRLAAALNTLPAELRAAVGPVIETAVVQAGAVSLRRIVARARFDITNPLATEAAGTITADLVKQVSRETKKSLRVVIQQAFKDRLPPAATARRIKPLVGLHSRQTQAVRTFRARLVLSGLGADLADARAERYAAKLLRQRSYLIARTETIRALSAGQQAAWRTARDAGRIRKNALQRWSAVGDDRLCPICLALDGIGRKIGQQFPGGISYPPAHPACRCTLVLQTRRRREQARPAEVSPDLPAAVSAARSAASKRAWETIRRKRALKAATPPPVAPRPLIPPPAPRLPIQTPSVRRQSRRSGEQVRADLGDLTADLRNPYNAGNVSRQHILRKESAKWRDGSSVQWDQPALKKKWSKELDGMERMVDPELLKKVLPPKISYSETNRAHSRYWESTVGIKTQSSPGVMVHELSHLLEADRETFDAAVGFLRKRAGTAPIQRLSAMNKNIAYDSSEIAVAGNFSRAYTGKVYRSQGVPGKHKAELFKRALPSQSKIRAINVESTEIISTGMEQMWLNPAKFAKDDPEFFDFIWETIVDRGRTP